MKSLINYFLYANKKNIILNNLFIIVLGVVGSAKLYEDSVNVMTPIYIGMVTSLLIAPFFRDEFRDEKLNIINSFPIGKDEIVKGVLGYGVCTCLITVIIQSIVMLVVNLIFRPGANTSLEIMIMINFCIIEFFIIFGISSCIYFKYDYEKAQKYSNIALGISIFVTTIGGFMILVPLSFTFEESVIEFKIVFLAVTIFLEIIILKFMNKKYTEFYQRRTSHN